MSGSPDHEIKRETDHEINRLKRVAVVGDLTGFGRCALAVSLPVISAMGVQACPLPTAVISAIPYHDSHFYLDLSDGLEDYIAHWEELGLRFDAVLAGFMCSVQELRLVSGYIKRLREQSPTLVVADPVMGDGGRLYSMVKPDTPAAMRELVRHADVITPNLTEAFALANMDYADGMTESLLHTLLSGLRCVTDGDIIIKSVDLPNGRHNVLFTGGETVLWPFSPVPGHYHGCGDFFVSVLTARMAQGDGVRDAFFLACEKTSRAVVRTYERQTPPLEGLLFEGFI